MTFCCFFSYCAKSPVRLILIFLFCSLNDSQDAECTNVENLENMIKKVNTNPTPLPRNDHLYTCVLPCITGSIFM